MSKPLMEMTLEELWQLFPIKLTEHQSYWDDWYQEEKDQLFRILPTAVNSSYRKHVNRKNMGKADYRYIGGNGTK